MIHKCGAVMWNGATMGDAIKIYMIERLFLLQSQLNEQMQHEIRNEQYAAIKIRFNTNCSLFWNKNRIQNAGMLWCIFKWLTNIQLKLIPLKWLWCLAGSDAGDADTVAGCKFCYCWAFEQSIWFSNYI